MSGARFKKQEFAERLLTWRTQRGWTREESAAKLGVSHRTLQEWEQGRRALQRPSCLAERRKSRGGAAKMTSVDGGKLAL
jgi:DNA-binding XRE family transcriptional regulator